MQKQEKNKHIVQTFHNLKELEPEIEDDRAKQAKN